jgi:phage gp36-like protein
MSKELDFSELDQLRIRLQARYNIAHNAMSSEERKTMELPIDASSDSDSSYVSELSMILQALELVSVQHTCIAEMTRLNEAIKQNLNEARSHLGSAIDHLNAIASSKSATGVAF